MTDPVLDEELLGVLRRLPPAAGDPLREDRVKQRCRERLASERPHRATAARLLHRVSSVFPLWLRTRST